MTAILKCFDSDVVVVFVVDDDVDWEGW